jgi:hypothetical protein
VPDTVTVEPTPTPAPSASVSGNGDDGDDGDLQLVLNLAAKLGVQLPEGDADKVRTLEQANQMLIEQNRKLKTQVDALKAAIATLS